MKLKPGFDDEFQPEGQQWALPVRSICRLMLMVAVCGAGLSVLVGMGKHNRKGRYFPARVQRPVRAPQTNALVAQPRDPFVVVATAEIDAKMVVAAPVGIDEAMVFNPYTGEQQSAQGAPAPGNSLMSVPGAKPGQVPENYYFAPHGLPQLPAPTQPR